MCNKFKIAFLDRDGTIIKDYPDKQWATVKYPEFLEGAIAGMQRLLSLGFKIIIVTNQYLISDKIITTEQYHQFTDLFLQECKDNEIDILRIYYCPHNDKDHCNCKKPRPGMIYQALADYNIDLSKSIYLGDSECDYQLAKQFHLPFYAITTTFNQKDVVNCKSILDVCQYLLHTFFNMMNQHHMLLNHQTFVF